MKVTKNKPMWLVMAVLTSIFALLYSSARVSYYFIDRESVSGASVTLLAVMIAVFVMQIAVLLRCEKLRAGWRKALFILSVVFTVIFAAVVVVYAVMGWEMWGDYAFYIRKSLPYFLVLWFGVLSVLFLPRLRGKAKAVGSIALCACLLFGVIAIAFSPFSFSFAALPTVFVKGEDAYSVVWATNAPSTGELNIVKGGVTHSFKDENAGNLRTNDCVHHITVPMQLLEGCEYYQVTSTHVRERTGYSLWSGKTLSSDRFTFRSFDEKTQKLTIWSLSDWHEHAYLAEKTVADFPEADVLIMGGDALNMVNNQESIIQNLLSPCANLTASAIPVIFARGNHECRGDYADELMSDLGLDSFYFTFRLGSLGGVVLDMGEGNKDDFVEYWSLADYEAYRDRQEEWLQTLEPLQTKYCLAITHDELFEAEADNADARKDRRGMVDALVRLDTDLLVAGHLHESIVRKAGENGRTFPTLVDGGINKDRTFTAGLIEINGEEISVCTINTDGTTEVSETFLVK